ncbi:MAG: hypothetical protein JWP57_4230 [Spirosoma sp.]|nr:hypothetical protein [Spirosoma sp.]
MPSDDYQPNPQSVSFPPIYQTAFALMDQGFSLLEKVDTRPQQPTDFRYLLVNPAFGKHTGRHDVIGKTIRQLVPGAEESTMAIYDQVALTGQSTQFEAYVASVDRWIEVNVFRISSQPA